MTVSFSITAQADHLRVEVSGARTPGRHAQEMLAGWTRVAEQCRATGLRRVLGVSAVTGIASPIEAYDVGRAGAALFIGAVDRIAYVVRGGEEALQVNRFAEDVAVNRGLTVRVFDDEEAARLWLLG
jgi:hypothetical protein